MDQVLTLDKQINSFNQIPMSHLKKEDFLPIFVTIYGQLNHFEFSDLKKVKSVLEYYQIVKENESEEDDITLNYYMKIYSSGVYTQFIEDIGQMQYPNSEETLYQLELEYIELLKSDEPLVLKIQKYMNLLCVLDRLSSFVSQRTFYIMHNMLLYYKELLQIVPESLEEFANIYENLVKQDVYQKYKRKTF